MRLSLMLGRFEYGKRGILDLTHTRLFTFATMFEQPFEEWSRRLRPDYDYRQRLKVRDILVITRQKPSAKDQSAPDGNRRFNPRDPPELAPLESTPPDGYRIFARRVTPRS